jgi:hypothetical protein
VKVCVKCRRGWVPLKQDAESELCPTCRAKWAPLSRLVGGKVRKGGA